MIISDCPRGSGSKDNNSNNGSTLLESGIIVSRHKPKTFIMTMVMYRMTMIEPLSRKLVDYAQRENNMDAQCMG